MRPIEAAPYLKAMEGAGELAALGPAPMLQWVPIAQLRVDPRYQREISAEGRRTVLAIARKFDWRKFAPVVVAPVEGGFFAIIDGQHRTTAAAIREVEQVPCLVVIADGAAQADAFAAINGQVTRLHSMAIYHARVAAGDPDALALQKVCAAAEVTVTRYPIQATKLARGETIAPNVLLAALNRYGADTLTTALQCVTQTSDGNPAMLCKPVIEALCLVLGAAAEWRDAGSALLDAMDDFDFKHELIEARVACARGGGQTVAGTLSERLTSFLTKKLGVPGRDAAE